MEEWKVVCDEPKYMINMQKDSDQSSGSKRGLDSEGGEMSISNTQHQRPQGRDVSNLLKGKSKKISRVEVVEKAVECHEDYMAFRKIELERYEAMKAAKLRTKNMKLYMKLKKK
ncbi:hypothetical protein LIER_06900 [Lithospermum erythrorhizon]|uniref:Uncharacterized protein n=1 Tax=Lithospermum erythrorhizon TaxID=34254 RepID=A0AAV3P629_LITER